MGGKPKASSKPPTEEDDSATDNLEKPLRPRVQLRRSSRRLNKTTPPRDNTLIQGNMLGIGPSRDENMDDDEETQDRKKSVKEDMQVAIEGLARMEQRLKTATKKQKLQVEQALCSAPPEVPSGGAPNPQSFREAGLEMGESKKQNQLLTPDEESNNDRFAKDITGGKSQDPQRSRIDAPEEAPDIPERGAARAPPVNSDYLPLPWKGRLGYACLNTYLRSSKTPVFCSRTCRMATIIDHRYPLRDPSQPGHPVKNRPDKSKEPDKELGDKFLKDLGLTNARDIIKILKWNNKFGISFMRLSSDMFPFASHPEHGYKLATFASEVLSEAGKVAAELGHRLTTHPGQFTQLGSPRKEVIEAAVRDLEYHDEMLSLLRLPEQQNRDAVMILHMGGVYGDKAATLDRFRKNYAKLSPSVKARLVLENDDVGWTVHDLLPICEELDIPLVLDFHHHNIMFDPVECREGTYDISQPELQERIAATWRRKGIKQKMHYSEPTPGAVTPRDRRKHSPRVATLPPCSPDMDLMIEAKDKEQAVFELMRNFKLPGFDRLNDMIPHEREDEPRPAPQVAKKKQKPAVNLKRKRAPDEDPIELNDVGAGADDQYQETTERQVPDEDIGMGGPDSRVYWPPGMDHWLKPNRKGAKAIKTDDSGKDEC